jgi:hypothetical protein
MRPEVQSVLDNRFGNDCAKTGHPVAEPLVETALRFALFDLNG